MERRSTPRLGDSRAPATTVVVLAAAAVAVIAGFLVLGSISNESDSPDEVASDVATTTIAAPASTTGMTLSTVLSTTTTTTTTTTVAPSASKSAATVVVVNANGVNGTATAMANDLAADGYTTSPVANATGPRLEQSVIYYLRGDATALAVARLLAEQIPSVQALPMPEPPPLDRPLNAATVALMLGTDIAGRPLAELRTG
jgi:hypothetical protein